MTNAQAIQTLRDLASKSQAAADFFLSCATRQRGRGTLTVQAVEQRMLKEGFNHAADEYRSVLNKLAEVGFGSTSFDRQGRLRALVNITTQLKDIGLAVVGSGTSIATLKQRNKYASLKAVPTIPKPIQVIALPRREAEKPPGLRPTEAERAQVKRELLSSVDGLVKAILSDTSIPAERRTAAALALLEA